MKYTAADTAFSRYLRKSQGDVCTCFICGKRIHWTGAVVMHYIKRRHLSTRWDQENCHVGCVECNHKDEVDPEFIGKHAIAIVEKHGPDVIARLAAKKNSKAKLTMYDVKEIEKHYKRKLKRLE